jgi:transposase
MFLKCNHRSKDGKEHRYWSIVENRRCAHGRVVQRQVLYLGEINDSQREAWIRCIEVFDAEARQQVKLALFFADRSLPAGVPDGVQVQLEQFSLHRARQWGACWLFVQLWKQLHLDQFWSERLAPSREGTDWHAVLQTLVAYRWIEPGSEWRLHRHWYDHSAMGDLLGADFAVAAKDTLYRCLDRLLPHKRALFDHLRSRWADLFGVKFEVLLYDLTSTYFESIPPFGDKRQFGYSRDHRPDCVQVVLALMVTPEGFPLAYEVLAGNTADRTTLPQFLQFIEQQYGKADRIWVMDRGIPTDKILAQMRASDPPVGYLVGTPKGRLSALEKPLLEVDWQRARPSVRVKLLPQDGELYILTESQDRVSKERAMRRRRLKRLWQRLHELREQTLSYERLWLKLGEAKKEAGRAWRLVEVSVTRPQDNEPASFTFRLHRARLREAFRREGRYLLRSNLGQQPPARLWEFYLQLVEIEQAFKHLKDDLALRPIFHRLECRIEAHIFVAFLAYCLLATLRHQLRQKAPGLTARAVLEKFATLQMLDVHFPTTDGRRLIFSRYTQPEKDHLLLLAQLGFTLPSQPPPRITRERGLEVL